MRAEYRFSGDSRLRAGASYAAARIEDNLAFPFGCNDAPVQYFCADGSYVLYDYQAKELRRTGQLDVSLLTRFTTGELRHRLVLGAEAIGRRIRQRDFYSTTNLDALGRGQTGNLADVSAPLPAPPNAGVDRPGNRATQAGLFAADAIDRGSWRLQVGARLARVRQAPSSEPERSHLLPQVALIRRFGDRARVYAAAATGLEFGTEAPVVAENAGQVLPPRRTRQLELGWKREWESGAALSAALFRMRRPYDFTDPVGSSFAGLGAFRRAGYQVHEGVEVAAQGRVAPGLSLAGSATFLRARAYGTGVPAFEAIQLQNIPRLRSILEARYAFESMPGAEGSLTWHHAGRRNARRDGLAEVEGYHRFDAGFAWSMAGAGPRARLQASMLNIANKRYWRDVGEAYSADLLFPGAPRTLYLGLSVDFL
jgi:iron complex outermembrane receptor protein